MIRALTVLILLAFFITSGCSSLQPCPPVGDPAPPISPAELDSVLFLIGDAGEALPEGEPVLAALRAALEAAAESLGGGTASGRVAVAFLGDNIYPAGMPDPGHRNYEEARARLDAQIEAVPLDAFDPPSSTPVAVFVPGNHDWNHNHRDGVERLRNQANHLEERSGGQIAMLPGSGCPGPAVRDLGERLRLVVLDTQWWLRTKAKPEGCEAGSEEAVLLRLRQQLEAGPRSVVVAAHHPLISGGPHGGETGALRRLGKAPQDIPAERYQRMGQALTSAFADHPPLVYAAGHDHSLQLIRGGSFRYQLVSGSGSSDKVTEVSALDDTIFCRQASGFMRLDVARDGRVRLGAWAVEGSSRSTEIFSTYLEPGE